MLKYKNKDLVVGMNELEILSFSLPKDIQTLKQFGDFEKAKDLIRHYQKNDIPIYLNKRLELEYLIIDEYQRRYPYSFEEAYKEIKKNFPNATKKELLEAKENGYADWIYVNGKEQFFDNIALNFMANHPKFMHELPREIKIEEENRIQSIKDFIQTIKKSKREKHYFQFKHTICLKDHKGEEGEKIKVYIPFPQLTQTTYDIKLLSTSSKKIYISNDLEKQRTICFNKNYREKEKFQIEYSFVNDVRLNIINPDNVSLDESLDFCIDEVRPHIVFSPLIKTIADDLVKNEKNPLIKAWKVYKFITQNIRHNYMRSYITYDNIPSYTIINLKGDCGAQALLFITMCRYLKIPSRWRSGIFINPYSIGNHDWAEIYVKPYGWITCDPSFGGAGYRAGDEDKWKFYFGNVDPFRIATTSAFQSEFDPSPVHIREDPFDNQLGEVEFTTKKIRQNDLIIKRELIKHKKL